MVEKDNSKEEKNIKSDLSTNINLKPEFFSEIDKNNQYIGRIKSKVEEQKGKEKKEEYPMIEKYKILDFINNIKRMYSEWIPRNFFKATITFDENISSDDLYNLFIELSSYEWKDYVAEINYLKFTWASEINNLNLSWFNLGGLKEIDFWKTNIKQIDLSGSKLDANLFLDNTIQDKSINANFDKKVFLKNYSSKYDYYHKSSNDELKLYSRYIDLDKFLNYFYNKSINIWYKKEKIRLQTHKNLILWLLKTCKNNEKKESESDDKYFERIQWIYEVNIINFIQKWKEKLYNIQDLWEWKEKLIPKSDNIVFSAFIEVDASFDIKNIEKSDNYFKTLCSKKNFKNYNVNYWKPKKPEKVIKDIKDIIEKNPDSQIIIKMGWHWWEDWSMDYNWFKFTKKDFEILFNLWPNVHINISSCNNWYKDNDTKYDESWKTFEDQIKSLPNFANNNLGSLVLDSSLQMSLGWDHSNSVDYIFFDAFQKKDENWEFVADYDWNWIVSYHEALIYRSLNYNESLTPISFDDDNDPNTNMIEIVENWEKNMSERIG